MSCKTRSVLNHFFLIKLYTGSRIKPSYHYKKLKITFKTRHFLQKYYEINQMLQNNLIKKV
jgi:hypothetical protein